jgi:glycosyltransferase involved in cell wall biosynthesis/ribosomal protein S18 acetylase RimI-like enzyme
VGRPIRIAHLATVDLSLRYLLLGQLRALRAAGFEVAAISAPGPWSAGLEAEGIRHLPWHNASRAWSPRADARAFFELLRMLRRERFDLLHTHNPKPGVMGRPAARLAGVPCVANTVHGLYATSDDPARRRLPVLALEKLAGCFSDLELYQSGEDLTWARRIGVVPPSRSRLLGNGVDLGRFDPARVSEDGRDRLRRELGIPDGALVVAAVGRLVAEKGYRELFSAAKEIRSTRDDVRFVVAGQIDRDKADAIGAAEVEAARRNVIFAGWRQDVRELLALADVFVLASWREGMPRSAIEAAAMGKPLVLTDIRGCREVARHGVEGLLVPPRHPERLADAITALLDDRALRERLGGAARSRARELFDERRVTQLLLAEYRGLLERKGFASEPDAPLRVRRARAEDAVAMARIHREALPDAFLPTLGERFLTRLYRALADDRGTVALVAEEGRTVLGFAAGVVNGRSFLLRFAARHGIPALAAAFPRLLRAGSLRRAGESARHAAAGPAEKPDSELLAIAVIANARGRGIGRMLAAGVLSGLGELGAGQIKVVVAADNAPGNGLYAAMGFRHRGGLTLHEGIQSNVWVAPCPS